MGTFWAGEAGLGLANRRLIEVRGLAKGPVDKCECLGAGLAIALSIDVRGWGPGWLGQAFGAFSKVPLIATL